MASVNKVILVGNCGRDPEICYLPSGQAVANVSVATSSRRKDKNTGETIEDTQWHRVTFYDRLAEIAGEYVRKGRPIYVEGRLKYGTYVDKATGAEKNTVDIIATELHAGRPGMGGPGVVTKGSTAPAPPPHQPAPRPATAPAPRQAPAPRAASGLTTWTTTFRFEVAGTRHSRYPSPAEAGLFRQVPAAGNMVTVRPTTVRLRLPAHLFIFRLAKPGRQISMEREPTDESWSVFQGNSGSDLRGAGVGATAV
jgi:single-strand DNA-binding protein